MNIKLRRNVLTGVILGYIALVFILFHFIGSPFLKYLEFINCTFVLLVTIASMYLLGYRKNDQNKLKLSILFITMTLVLMYFTLSYGIGLFNGFLRNSFSLRPIDIVNNSCFIILIIIFSEILRYVLINSNKESNGYFIVITIIMCLFDYCNCFNIYNYDSLLEILKFVSLFLLPTLVKNTSLSYVCKHGGFYPCVFYRLLVECYIYFVPIVPNLGDFIDSAFLMILPFLVYTSNSRMVNEHYNGIEHNFSDKAFNIWDVPIIGSLVLLIILISGIGPLYLVGVASASMEPEIYVGDAALLKKVDSKDKFKVGDVIAFKKDKKVVVHRIVDVIEENGKYYYDTKGDNNNGDDGVYLGIEDIQGLYLFKIPYAAKLSVWFNERKGG